MYTVNFSFFFHEIKINTKVSIKCLITNILLLVHMTFLMTIIFFYQIYFLHKSNRMMITNKIETQTAPKDYESIRNIVSVKENKDYNFRRYDFLLQKNNENIKL